jgi:hypothetical protein
MELRLQQEEVKKAEELSNSPPTQVPSNNPFFLASMFAKSCNLSFPFDVRCCQRFKSKI